MPRPRPERGHNSVQLRRYNERLLLETLRRAGEASKADLARKTHSPTPPSAASSSRSEEKRTSLPMAGAGSRPGPTGHHDPAQPGRRILRCRRAPDRDSIETVLVDFDGAIPCAPQASTAFCPPRADTEMVRTDIDAVLAVLGSAERKRLAGVGLAQPFNPGVAPINWSSPRPISRLGRDRLLRPTGKATGLPVFSENDGNAAAIAELLLRLRPQPRRFHTCSAR